MSCASGRRGWRSTPGRTRRPRVGAIKRVADQLGVHPEALRTWVRQAEIDGGVRPGTTTDDATSGSPSSSGRTGSCVGRTRS